MKTSLTQAWEATGFTGYTLRGKVEMVLAGRFHKENPDVEKAWGRVSGGILGMLMVFGLLWVWMGIVAKMWLMYPLDLSQSIQLLVFICAVIVPAIAAIIAVMLFYLSAGRNFQKALKMPSVYRYVFQHRDDEIEL